MSWSRKYMTVIMLTSELYKKISDIQNKYRVSDWKDRIGPHITLNRPFTIKRELTPFLQILSDTAKRHQPFTVNLDGVDIFSNKKEVIYARVALSPALLGLQRYLNLAIDNYVTATSPAYGFTPHVTLSNHLTVQEADAQLAEIRGLEMQDEFLCKGFRLMYLDEAVNTWHSVNYFPLLESSDTQR